MIDFAVWVMAGAMLGYLSSARGGDSGPGKMLNVLTGVVGAYLAGLIITPLFMGAVSEGSASVVAAVVALAGAVILLAVVNTPRRGRAR
jgi:uncharacterized membrane protein YeaQ/YmgE (transglycosylase-associated protein family)